jgi:hypothetical protein
MFRKTEPQLQFSMYSSVIQHLTETSNNIYKDKNLWHNVFYKEIVSRIDETLFTPLFSETNGAPNSSIRILVGMMILKEGEGCSDQKLFENARFNLLFRKALGLVNMDDSVPTESTYYLFRKNIGEYFKKTGIDLFEACFKQITKGQIIDYQVSGQSLRMDSKLIGSNIAFYSRYELIHKSLVLFYKSTPKEHFKLLSDEKLVRLESYVKEKSADTVYRSTKEQIKEKLGALGMLIYSIIQSITAFQSTDYVMLKQVFKEQYNVEEDAAIQLKANKEISAKSIQSPHDTECDYRRKNDEDTKGYSHNIAETCDENNPINLITNVQTAPASKADNEFTKPATTNSQKLLQDKISNIHTDGAYHSEDNQMFTREEGINFYLTGFQGAVPRYELTKDNNTIRCIDTKENVEVEVVTTPNGKYRIKTEKGYRYFTDKEIEKQVLRKEIEQIPKEIANKRNNVEASIYQLAYPLRKDKTKYRGFFKNKIWAILRCTWINCVRIAKYIMGIAKNEAKKVNNTLLSVVLTFLIENLFNFKAFRLRSND